MASEDDGWTQSAKAWLAQQGEQGDWARRAVLDPVLLPMALAAGDRFVDIGCGEGRFTRMLSGRGMAGCGIDPTEPFIAAARQRDPGGSYRVGHAGALPWPDGHFDLALFYLSLIDIADFRAAIAEAVRVVRPGGRVLVANLSSINSAGQWHKAFGGAPLHYAVDRYAEERPIRQQWAGIDVINWHRPLSAYLAAFLAEGLILRSFLEPLPQPGAEPDAKFTRVPWFVVMEWEKPA